METPSNQQPVFVPVNEPVLNGNEKRYLTECIDGGWISSEGPFVGKFEQLFAAKMGRQFGIAVCNGSVALDAAVAALGIGKGDEVIMPSFTIISCAAAVVRAGAVPVLVDSDADTWNMRADLIAEKITARTRAIMVVHIYGLPVDMNPILEIARQNNLYIIEDAAEMHGQTYRGKPCGSFGDISTFSFYPNKHITTGEGGMILTDDPAIAEHCRSLRNLCFKPERRFVHEELGWNFRMSNIQAALGLAQLERLDESVAKKRKIGRNYTKLLRDLPVLQLPLERTEYADNIYWVYGVVLRTSSWGNAHTVMNKLASVGIGTRPFFYPMNLQPVFNKMGLFLHQKYPVAEQIAQMGFYLPSGLALTEEQLIRSAEAVKRILR